ncbi:acyl-CoA dehydrogenase [Mycolicibacterium chubuense NBB4]|uniref:Acyl-CoA dehydrogenase n=1 Tax=Mycolicibacterium chubuense (strain NBB4) TaxID=710421 RepID=I4BQ22_MYCCN|nr:acyl-CoA dehydrogenase [Mycolicibacterium chubuense]AFM19379.1 acyl-CoA dehydrogenase [Mycolicibacterium chubuense NBB4]
MPAGSLKSSATINDEQSAARELVRSWAAGSSAVDAARDVEQGDAGAWRAPYDGLAQLGIFGVALPEEHGGADGTVADLCAMVDEAAAALVPGPVATTALATLVLSDSHTELLEALATGGRTAGVALSADLTHADGRASGTAPYVLGADSDGVLLLPAGEVWLLVDAAADGVTVEALKATDFSRPLARVVLDGAPAEELSVPAQRVVDLAATVAAAEAAGLARWLLDTATEYAKVREQFGKPIGSFQAVKHMCAEMLLRSEQASVAAADAARAAGEGDDDQLSVAAALAASVGVEAAKANAKDCIQVLGGIGITWEHDAHLYLRRAYGIAQFLGGRSRWLRRVAELTQRGVRRTLSIDLESVADLRPEIASAVADVAAAPSEKRQAALAEAGLLAPHWPRPYGRAAGPAEQLLIDQELAKADVTRPDLVIGWWAVPTILEHGSAEQIEQFVPATLRGELSWCQLFSEPGAGSDLAALRTKAVRAEGESASGTKVSGWKLTGQKVWTSAAQKAHWGVCLARTDPDAPKHKGITYFLIDMRSPGIVIRPLREITGDELFNEVFFDDVFVPDELVVGQVNDGWRLARTTLANERVAMAQGTALGNPMEELLRAVGELEFDGAQQDRLGALIVTAQVGSLLDQRIAQLAVGGRDPGPQASARKLIGVRYRQALAEFRMELSEGAGLVENQQVHDFLNTRCLTIAGGTEQILLTMAGERLLGLPR